MSRICVAVLVENHEYDVISFQRMLESFTDCECFVQPLDLFVRDSVNRERYETVLYYNMNIPQPEADSPLRKYMEQRLGETSQGIILVHHALLSFKHWDLYTEVSGVSVRLEDGLFRYYQNQKVEVHVVDKTNPITAGLQDFTLTDETYIIGEPDQPGNQILLTCTCDVGIKNIAWARRYRNSRVFATASGHDNKVYSDDNFRKLLHNAIRWTADK